MNRSLPFLIAISGAIASGKSTLINNLAGHMNFITLTTGELILTYHPESEGDRRAMLFAGAQLDENTEGKWIADAVKKKREIFSDDSILIDSLKTSNQASHLRGAFSETAFIHIHLVADYEVLRRRFEMRARDLDKAHDYISVYENEIEIAARALDAFADIIIDTGSNDEKQVAELAMMHIRTASQ